jgi:hypothetical protein
MTPTFVFFKSIDFKLEGAHLKDAPVSNIEEFRHHLATSLSPKLFDKINNEECRHLFAISKWYKMNPIPSKSKVKNKLSTFVVVVAKLN